MSFMNFEILNLNYKIKINHNSVKLILILDPLDFLTRLRLLV